MGIFRLVRFVCCCFFGLLFVSQLTFASTRTVYAEPSDFQRAYTAGTGGQSHVDSRSWNADVDTGQGSRSTGVQTRRGYGWDSFKGVAKNAAKGGVAGVMGSLALAYLMDQIPGASYDPITGEPVRQPDYQPSGTVWIGSAQSNPTESYKSSTYGGSCDLMLGPPIAWYIINKKTKVSETRWDCLRAYNSSYCPTCTPSFVGYTTLVDVSCQSGWDIENLQCYAVAPTPVPFSEIDWDDLFNNSNTIPQAYIPPLVSEIDKSPYAFTSPDTYDFTGPSEITGQPTVTTSTNPSTGSTTTTEHLPSTQLEYGVDPLTITTTEISTTTTYTDGNVTNVTNTTNYSPTPVTTPATGTGGAPATEVPTDCAFMPTVCEFIGWVKTPFDEPEPDLSELIDNDQDFERSVTFASNASCPAPLVFNTSKGQFEFSLEPACQWMGYMKPLIIIAALISAVFISLGAFRGGD